MFPKYKVNDSVDHSKISEFWNHGSGQIKVDGELFLIGKNDLTEPEVSERFKTGKIVGVCQRVKDGSGHIEVLYSNEIENLRCVYFFGESIFA